MHNINNNIFIVLTLLSINCFVFQGFIQAQGSLDKYTLSLHSGLVTLPENVSQQVRNPDIDAGEVISGRYYRIIQFYNLPDKAARTSLESEGLSFMKYLGGSAYLASLPEKLNLQLLADAGLRSIVPLEAKFKIAPNLLDGTPAPYALKGDRIRIILQYYDDVSKEEATSLAKRHQITVLEASSRRNLMEILAAPDELEGIAALPFVKFIERIPPPGMPEDDLGRGLHRSNVLDANYAGGRKYTGEGVNVLVRDDGIVGPHIDFKGRLENLATGDGGIDHADGVAGVMGGAGNLNPVNRATAPGAYLYVINYVNNFLDTTLGLHIHKDVKITNSSYSDGCNDGYTSAAQTVDEQIHSYPTLMHVFSAGNSNGANCGYGAGAQWGNITGGHKQAKNSIATGNLNADGTLVNSSSRGPAYDGRIKPDICANGQNYVAPYPNNTYEPFGGTSGAAPGIAGTMATLFQAYRALNNGQDPESALIKACLLNTANDLGNKGPDYRFGWGHVNARRAVEVLENQTYYSEEIDQGASNIQQITVPENIIEMRVMLYWADPAASVLTTKALVNDLDLRLTDGVGVTFLPLVLDPTPEPASLDAPAVPGTDNLNNVEQVFLENPAAGTYSIEVLGSEVPEGPQKYYIVYELITDEITVTYPIGGEGFQPFTQERIHWDAFGNDGEFTISYSVDDGANWTDLSTVPGSTRMYNWNIPNNVSGKALVKVTRDSSADTSDANFSILSAPQNLNIVQVCPDFLRMAWNPSPGANKFDIFKLGERYMDSIATSSLLIYDLPDPFPMTEELWLAVRAKGNDGLRSRRSTAISYDGGLLNCTQENDLASAKLSADGLEGLIYDCDELNPTVSMIIINEGTLPATAFPVYYQVNGNAPKMDVFTDTILPETMKNFSFSVPLIMDTSGNYEIVAWTSLQNNDFSYNDTLRLSIDFLKYDSGNALSDGYTQGFESAIFPPDLWLNQDYDADEFKWQEGTVTGINGVSTKVAWASNFTFNGDNTEDALIMPLIDLSQSVYPALTFDYAYTYYAGGGTFTDGLRVDLSLDCGETYTEVLFDKEGAALATVPPISSNYLPGGAEDWKTEVLDLTPFVGQTVIVRFVNINGYGNNMYLDNINLVEIQEPTAALTASTQEICQTDTVSFLAINTLPYTEYNWNFGSGAIPESASGIGPHTVQYMMAGQTPVQLNVSNIAGSTDAQENIVVNPLPVASFTVEELGEGAFSFQNTSTDGLSYNWDFGDNSPGSTVENPSHQYAENGEFTVTLTVTNDCGTIEQSQQVNVVLNSLESLNRNEGLSIFPNPNNGTFQIRFSSRISNQIHFELLNLQGQRINAQFIMSEDKVGRQIYNCTSQDISAGVYCLKIIEGNNISTQKVIVHPK